MRASKVTAIILKRFNFGEGDKIVTVFSQQQGKISVVAKGVRRIKSRRAPHLEPLNEVEMVLHKNVVTEAKSRPKKYYDLKSLSFALYGAEIVDKLLPENEPHEDVYFLFKNFLAGSLDEAQAKQFTLELLWQSGFFPRGQFPRHGLTAFVESLAERRVKSRKLIKEILDSG